MKSFLAIICCFLVINSHAQTAFRQQQFNVSDGRLAIEGYDPVAYFTAHKPAEGNKSLALEYDGLIYYFSSDANRKLFRSNPTMYEPQYGGWCAYAMGSSGEKVAVDPETFKILNNKLYLFYNKFFNNTLKSWNKDETSLNAKADANWAKYTHGVAGKSIK